MTDVQAQVEQLRFTVAQQEQELAELEAEIARLRSGMDEFEVRYNRVVKPVSDRVQAAKAALRQLQELEYKRRFGDDRPVESLWRRGESAPRNEDASGYTSKRERHTPQSDNDDDLLPSAERHGDQDSLLKKLYRRLAQKYHPDKAGDAAVRAIYTRLMALINTAYAEKDVDALLALDNSPAGNIEADTSLATLQLRHLQQKTRQLRERLQDLKIERSNLSNSIMMDLKVRASLARSRGRDMLKDIAADLEKEYQDLMAQIDTLRRKLL